jgi:SET domain-containing protein
MKYRPLPDYLTIQPSKIEGLGLFAIKDIPAYEVIGMTHAKWFGEPDNLLRTPLGGEVIGMTHAKWFGEPDNLLRTPLGGFINHSDTPNCEIQGKMTRYLYTLEDIEPGSELTVKYKMYSV